MPTIQIPLGIGKILKGEKGGKGDEKEEGNILTPKRSTR